MRLFAVSAAVLVVAGCGGSHHAAATRAPVAHERHRAPLTPAQRVLGLPAVSPSSPVPGYLMIADRDNGRILILDPRTKRIVWRFDGLHDPDDAFFAPGWRTISTNMEYNQTIALIGLRSHRIVWSYGHPDVRGSSAGYLSNPDDAYLLRNGDVMVADIVNCRVLVIDHAKKVVREFGRAGSCGHQPPVGLSSPNGATPLPDGGVLVTEIGGWVDRISKSGKLLWTIRTPTTYPSDAQLLPDGNVLVAGFDQPGRVDEITPAGRVVWTYEPTGYWSLDRPSLAVRWPNGMIAITDDWHHRVVVVDPVTKRVVWSYGHLDRPGRAAGYLDKPDGLDLLPAVASNRLLQSSSRLSVRRVGSLPGGTLAKAAAVALPRGRMMVLGGERNGASVDTVLAGPPARLRLVGHLPTPTHDAAAALLDGAVYLFGGGQASSVPTVTRVSLAGKTTSAHPLGEPLSDLGAAAIGGRAYLVGGYTGSRYADAILRYPGKVVARLPAGTRYAGVAAIGRTIYVAGGITTAGTSDAVYAVAPGGSPRRVATLPAPEAHAALAALDGKLYLVGGNRVLAIDPSSGAVSTAATLPAALTDPAAVVVGGRIVVSGGGTDAVYALSARR